jgi:type VII secretion effector (TIGR04197 family)
MSETISSNSNVAQQFATGISQSLQQISQHTITTANQTTVQGNSLAKSSSETGSELITAFRDTLFKDLDNLKSVASEFEALNQELTNVIFTEFNQ